MRSITASRTGSESLLDKFDKTRSAVASTKADRGIREKLAAGAANTPQPAATSSSSSGFKLSAPKPAAPAPKPVAPKPLSSGPKPFSSSSGPKPAAPKPASPKPAGQSPKPAAPKPATPAAAAPAAAAGSGAGFGGAIGPIAQAIGVLGVVSVGANAVTNFATSNSEVSRQTAVVAAGLLLLRDCSLLCCVAVQYSMASARLPVVCRSRVLQLNRRKERDTYI